MEQALSDFLLCLQEARYYDAHEVLEKYWYPRRFEDCDETRLIKGFINAAVSFELVKLGRPAASERAWSTYLKYRPLAATCKDGDAAAYHRVIERIEQVKVALS